MRRIFPLLGVSLSVAILIVAAGHYPGGYDWFHQSVSSLFQPATPDGEANDARRLACLGIIGFCMSMGIVFATVAKRGPTRFHRKTVQVAGIGSMVYAALTVTPMHDVLVGAALLFFLTAVLTIVHGLYLNRRFGMLGLGIASLALVLGNAAMYYGEWLYGFLPVVQKASLGMWVVWLFALYFSNSKTSHP